MLRQNCLVGLAGLIGESRDLKALFKDLPINTWDRILQFDPQNRMAKAWLKDASRYITF